MANRRTAIERWVRITVFVLALLPLARMVAHGLTGGLGANPIEEVTHRTGWWTLTFLMLALTVTPAQQLTAIGWLIKLRRMLGLYAFFYATLHFGIYIGIDQFFAWEFIVEDIMDRPYVTVGFTALVLLTPLAATSTKKMVKRLGGQRWKRLHSLVYVASALGVLHFLWQVKADIREPAIFGGILVTLLGYRTAVERLRQLKIRRVKRASKSVRVETAAVPAEGSAATAQQLTR